MYQLYPPDFHLFFMRKKIHSVGQRHIQGRTTDRIRGEKLGFDSEISIAAMRKSQKWIRSVYFTHFHFIFQVDHPKHLRIQSRHGKRENHARERESR